MKNKKKLVIIMTAVAVVVAAGGAGAVHFMRNRDTKAVEVYSMDMLNSAGMYGDESELSGIISSDYVQEVYPSGGEDVSKVYVKQGDKVKEGDNLLQYNVEEEELDLKLQKLQIKASKMEIERMEKELQKMKGTKTTGALDNGNSGLANASMNLSSIKDSVISALMGENTKEEAPSSEPKETNTETKEEGSEGEKETEGDSSEQGTTATEDASSEEQPGEGSSESDGTMQEKPDIGLASVTSLSDKEGGDGTAQSPYIFRLKVGADGAEPVISGTLLRTLSPSSTGKGAKYATFELYKEGEKTEVMSLTPEQYLSDGLEDKAYAYHSVKGLIKGPRRLKDNIDSVSSSGYLLYKEGTVRGSVLQELMKKREEASFCFYETEESDLYGSVTLRPVYAVEEIEAAKDYSYGELTRLSQSVYRQRVLDVQADCAYGDGEADSAYVFNLNSNGTIKGSVIQELVNGDCTAIFRKYNTKADMEAKNAMEPEAKITASTPTLLDVNANGEYTVDWLAGSIQRALASIELSEKIEKKEDATGGDGKKETPYLFKMLENGQVKGAVINDILKNREYAVIGEYKLNKDGSTGDVISVIEIHPSTLFKESISSLGWYTVTDLNDLLVMANKVEIRPLKKTVEAGKTYKFSVKITGRNPEALPVSWTLKNNKSESTTLNDGELVVAAEETADSLRIIVTAGEKKAAMTVKVKKSSRKDSNGGKTDGGSDSSYRWNGGSGGGSHEEDYSSYTSEELREAISDKEDELAEAKQELKEARINYKEAKKEVDAATVKAKVSGEVTLAYTKEAMPTDGSPAIVVRSDKGMYVKVNVSEMALDTVKVGGVITCTSWESGEEYEAVVKEVSEYPVKYNNNYDVYANPNNSYYPVLAYIEDAKGLNTGENVSVTYDSQSMGMDEEDAICIQKAYIRTENKKSYVYKEGKDGRLKKQYIKTGSTIYGQYVEVLAGLSLDDNLAFPYGKNVKEGAKVKLSDNEENIIY